VPLLERGVPPFFAKHALYFIARDYSSTSKEAAMTKRKENFEKLARGGGG
jgi:hypothetical protein